MVRLMVNPARRTVVAAVALAVLAAGGACSGGPATPDYGARFDALWRDFDATYPYFTLKGVDWAAARDAYRPRAAAARDDAELAGVAKEMLGLLRDLHVVLWDPSGRRNPTYSRSVFRNHDPVVRAAYAARYGVTAEGHWGHGTIGGIPYAYVDSWGYPADGFDAWLETVRDAPAMVLDLRMNGGGNGGYALAVIERFADRTRIGGCVRYRNGPGHDDFTAPMAGEFSPGGPWQFTRPVLLLLGAGSVSATEDFASGMRELPHVTLAGDATGGSSGNPARRVLGGGWSYQVSRWYFTTPDGIVVEGHGIPPHVAVAATAADFAAGVDPVLDFAEEWAASPVVLRGG